MIVAGYALPTAAFFLAGMGWLATVVGLSHVVGLLVGAFVLAVLALVILVRRRCSEPWPGESEAP